MIRRYPCFVALLLSFAMPVLAIAEEVPQEVLRKAADVTPTPQQIGWQEMELTCFAHFGVNTFTDREWGEGNEDPKVFNPTAFDADQWVAACKAAGLKILILTCKHHDGFCLWPSRHTEYCVRHSPGGRDVVGEFVSAFRQEGLKVGLYYSLWDRNAAGYADDAAYAAYMRAQMTELLSDYGDVVQLWFDGAWDKDYPSRDWEFNPAWETDIVGMCIPRARRSATGTAAPGR